MAPPGNADGNLSPRRQSKRKCRDKRGRALIACETCHQRKVRCNAADHGIPCAGCVEIDAECKIRSTKHGKTRADWARLQREHLNRSTVPTPSIENRSEVDVNKGPTQLDGSFPVVTVLYSPAARTIMPPDVQLANLEEDDLDMLKRRGCFLVPSKALCDEMAEAFFTWVAPLLPIFDREEFMQKYLNYDEPPSMLLLQAIFLAGSRVSPSPQLKDKDGSTKTATKTFYRRAKALYYSNIESSPIAIVQALILFGWYAENPADTPKHGFFWYRIAICVAKSSFISSSVSSRAFLDVAGRRCQKRIWWTLFARDQCFSVAGGLKPLLRVGDMDMGMISEDDFHKEDGRSTQDEMRVQFFIQHIKLIKIMGRIWAWQCQQEKQESDDTIFHLYEELLADWLQNCPEELQWQRSKHNFWAAILNVNYQTTISLLQRSRLPPISISLYFLDEFLLQRIRLSQTLALKSALSVTDTIGCLVAHDELRLCPAFLAYNLLAALRTFVYQNLCPALLTSESTSLPIQVCIDTLEEMSKVWEIATIVCTIFKSILRQANLETFHADNDADNNTDGDADDHLESIMNVDPACQLVDFFHELRPRNEEQTTSPNRRRMPVLPRTEEFFVAEPAPIREEVPITHFYPDFFNDWPRLGQSEHSDQENSDWQMLVDESLFY